MLLLSQLHLQNKGQARHCAAIVALQGLTYKCVNDLLTPNRSMGRCMSITSLQHWCCGLERSRREESQSDDY